MTFSFTLKLAYTYCQCNVLLQKVYGMLYSFHSSV
ncbi:unnamed protein product [Brugia timori]|uniref:Uncharacterized protein n=1 Tax=Brugia timori TaxID=42155 RepID=A0A0R3R315_9BILA|nr:unnamed protein product [Brugia timori]